MLSLLELIAGVIVSTSSIGGLIYFFWKGSIKVKETITTTEETKCKVSLLEKQILRALTQMQQRLQVNDEKIDRRFDKMEKDLRYLFGRTNTTIPPKD